MYTPINVLRLARDGIKKLDQMVGGEDEVTTGIMATEQPVAETDPLVDTVDALDEAYSEVPGYRSVRTQAEPQSDVDARVYSMWRVGEVPVESPGFAMRSLVRFNPTSSMMGRMAQSRISDAVEEGTFTRNEDKEPETGLERFLDDPLGSVANFFFPPAGAQTEDDGLTAFLEQQPGVGVEFDDAPRGLMSPDEQEANSNEGFSRVKFDDAVARIMETDHGSTPVPTKDKKEKNIPEAQRSKDVGYGHKVTSAEESSGMIHGIPFKDSDGNYISLTTEQKEEILRADMATQLRIARGGADGWDADLAKRGSSWEELGEPYKAALNSLAFNVGGRTGRTWTTVLKAAIDEDIPFFAEHLRRKDNGENTAGMDNRVMKELYYAGLIKNRSEVADRLPLANDLSGVPE